MIEEQPDFFQQNISLLQQHKPALLPFADTSRDSNTFAITVANDGRCNLESIHPVTHEKESVHELNQIENNLSSLLALLDKEEQALVIIVGLGLGYEVEFLLKKFPEFRFIILEPSNEIFAAAVKAVDLQDVLSSPTVSLEVGPEINVPQLFHREDDALRALPVHLVCHQKLKELCPDTYTPLYNTLQTELLQFQGKLKTIVSQGPLLFNNTIANVPQLVKTVNVQHLSNIAPGMPAVCVASGPSLGKNLSRLKGMEDTVFIIAVDSAAKILIDNGILPHLVVSIDPIPASMTKLADVMSSHPELPLSWAPEAFPATVQGFNGGPQFIIPGINDLFRLHLAPLFDHQTIFPHMLSVMHAATQVAIMAGSNPIVYIGLDLALDGEKDHAAGAPVSWKNFGPEERLKVPGWHGGDVETIPVLQNQLHALQSIIDQHIAIRFIDATEGGARIPGTDVMPLQEALDRHAGRQKDYSAALKNVFTEAARPAPEAAIKTLEVLRKTLKASRKTAQQGLQNGREASKHWKLSKIPNKKSQALKKFKKAVVASGNAFDKLMDQLDLANTLYPLRAADHHAFIYARKQFNETAAAKTPEQRIFDELEQNIDYFTSWIATTKKAEELIAAVLKDMIAGGNNSK